MRRFWHILTDSFVYYLSIFWPIAFYLTVFVYFFNSDDSALLQTDFDTFLYYAKFLWFTGVLVAVSNIIGLIFFGSPLRRTLRSRDEFAKSGWNHDKRLIVTYVSRGENFKALDRAIKESARVMKHMDIDFRIDVITDKPVSDKIEQAFNTHFHLTPSEFATSRGTKYKARALHYMIEQRHDPAHHSHGHEDVWLLHLDEESIVTKDLVIGIHRFINNPKNHRVIGQGEIKYNAYKYGSNAFTLAADAIRTGDDLGRFRFQYKLFRKPIFGMHGSFVLVNRDIEREIGFDLSPKQSITEDAYFAFKAADRGIRFGWVDGSVREQSPYGLRDIILQRRRWFNGLWYLAFDREITFKTRSMLTLNMLLWLIAWAGPLLAIVNLFAGRTYFPLWATIVAAILQGAYTGIYMVGAMRNLTEVPLNPVRKTMLYLLTFILVPIVNAIEGLAVLYAIFKPVRGFHVVQKN